MDKLEKLVRGRRVIVVKRIWDHSTSIGTFDSLIREGWSDKFALRDTYSMPILIGIEWFTLTYVIDLLEKPENWRGDVTYSYYPNRYEFHSFDYEYYRPHKFGETKKSLGPNNSNK